MIKNAVIERIREKPTSISEKADKYFTLAYDYKGNFNRDEQLISSVQELTKEETINVLSRALDEKSLERATILLYAKEHSVGKNTKSTFENINRWKNTRKYQ